MKKIVLWLLLGFSSLSYALESNYLFLQGALSGYLTPLSRDTYSITLKKSSDISYFTDRPNRQSGKINLAQFLAMWHDKTIKNNFNDNPPNTAIVMVDTQNKWHHTIAIVTNPVGNEDTVTYQLQPIDGKPLPIGELRHVVLFFDDIRWNPGGI